MEENKEKIELIKKSFELKNLKKYKEALELLYKALEYDNLKQDNVELLSQIGDLHMQLKNYDRALDEFQKALAINKRHQYSIQKCYDIYYETNKLNKALNLAQKMCEENKTPQSYYNYFKALIKMDKTQDVIEIFNSLPDEIKLDVDILYLISTICTGAKKKLLLEKIISLNVYNTDANLDLAAIELENKNYSKVIQYCLNIEDDNPLALYYLGKVESNNKNYTKAIDLYTNAIKLDNDNHNFYFDLAKTYSDIAWFDEALLALKKSINLDLAKNNTNLLDEKYFLAGWILIKQNQLQKALLNLNSIDKNSKMYENAQILIQIINLKSMNLSQAKKKLEEYYEKDKNNIILIDTLAIVYKELKLNKQAIKLYFDELKINPNSIYCTLEIIDLLIDEKEYEKALEIIENFTERYQNCANIYNSLARIYYRLQDLNKAINSINKYIELDKNNAEAFYFRGLILNDLGHYEDARNSIYNAIKLNPNNAKYYSQMARSYQNLKEYKNALLYSKEAIEINPNEINFKKQAYEISLLIGDKNQIEMYKNQLDRSEKILKMSR